VRFPQSFLSYSGMGRVNVGVAMSVQLMCPRTLLANRAISEAVKGD
jgi:hypothetical protein